MLLKQKPYVCISAELIVASGLLSYGNYKSDKWTAGAYRQDHDHGTCLLLHEECPL